MKTKSLLFAVLLFGSASAANALTVAGISWVPLTTNPNTGFQFNFTQWYVDSAHRTSTGLNQAADVLNALTAPTQITNTSQLTGAGSVYVVNSTPTTPASQLSFTFGVDVDTVNTTTGAITFKNGGFANIYLDTTPPVFDPYTVPGPLGTPAERAVAQANVAEVADGDLWLSLTINNFTAGSLTGSAAVSASAQMSITGGAAAYAFDPNFFGTFAGQYNSSAFVDNPSQFSKFGNGQLRLDSYNIPEPSSLSLLGIGLLGFALSKKKKAKL
ncbi:MAG: PEP-CTERM sorting domain-containing protein [Candidatus Methylumidiphilus sp.]